MAFFAVNASGCPPPQRFGPEREPVPWPLYLGSPQHDVAAAETVAAAPQPQWTTDVGRAVRGSPALGTDVMVLGLTERIVTLLDRRSGQLFWRTAVSGTVHGGPLLREDRIYLATEQTPTGRVYALNLRDGRVVWRAASGGVSAPLALDGDALYAGTDRGTVLRLRARDGEITWSHRVTGAIRAAPVPTPAGVAVATTADTLYLLDTATGAARAQAATGGPVLGTPVTDGRSLYFGTVQGVVRAVTLEGLVTAWETTLPDAIYGALALVGDTLVVLARDGTLALFSTHAPEALRTFALETAVTAGPTVTSSGILIGTVAGDVLLVDRETGTITWRARVPGPIETPPLVRDGQVVVVGGRGEIHTYR